MSELIQTPCAAITKAGTPCKNRAQPDKLYCYIHRNFGRETAVEKDISPSQPIAPASTEETVDIGRMRQLVGELDTLVQELKNSFSDSGSEASPYSPLRLTTMMRDNLSKLPVDVQFGLLENFEGMSKEDLMDPDTWKGIAYMVGYSAKFQAGQAIDRVDSRLPQPLQRESLFNRFKENFDRYAPEIAKEVAANFEDATPQDFLDPDTWKGLFYMLEYSLRFQADQLKERLLGEEDE